jgi:hypothetical protein
MQSAKASISLPMENALTTIELHKLGGGTLLSPFHFPPPQHVPPANIHLTARTRNGSGRILLVVADVELAAALFFYVFLVRAEAAEMRRDRRGVAQICAKRLIFNDTKN